MTIATITIGGQDYQIQPFDAERMERFTARFKDQPLRDFLAFAKAEGLAQADILAFQREHFRHPRPFNEILDTAVATGPGLSYLLFLLLEGNPGVTEDGINGMPFDEGAIQSILDQSIEALAASPAPVA